MKHLYPWYSWPGRAVMLVWALGKSFLGDWRQKPVKSTRDMAERDKEKFNDEVTGFDHP